MYSRLFRAILIAAMCTPLVSYAAVPQMNAEAEQYGDAAILSGIKDAFAKERELSSANITAASNKGAVRLTGTVPSQTEADRAEALALGVKGVVTVDNQLEIGSVGATGGAVGGATSGGSPGTSR